MTESSQGTGDKAIAMVFYCCERMHRVWMCQRILCRFFEWDRKGSHKQPYFIYFGERAPTAEMQELAASGEEEEEEEEEEKGEEKGELW